MGRFKLSLHVVFLLGGLILLGGCSSHRVEEVPLPMSRLLWPAAPQEAKIEWLKEYKILEETTGRKGFWGKLGNFFLGPKTAHMTRPYGVCTDDHDQLFIADTGASVIHQFDMRNSRYRLIEGTPDIPLMSPIGLVHVEGQLYVTDSVQGAILQYDLHREQLSLWLTQGLVRPTGIAFSHFANLIYVSDTAAHQVIAYSRLAGEQFRFGRRGTADGEFNFPTDLWVDDAGKVYVTDALNARIQIFTATGEFLSAFGQPGDSIGSFAKPKGVVVDQHGHIYVCDALFDTVQIFNDRGQLLLNFGENGDLPGQFWMPSGLFIDSHSHIYVTDTYNRRIQVFKELTQ